MRRRLLLGLAVALAACSDDSGSGGGTPVPNVPWANFRHDNFNSGAGNTVIQNKGEVTQLCSTTGQPGMTVCPGDITESTPTIDRNFNVLLGMTNAVASFTGDPFCSERDSESCNGDSCLPFGATCDADLKLCTVGPDLPCTEASCAPFGATCDATTQRCTNAAWPTPCKPDSCLPDGGTCTGKLRWIFDECEIDGFPSVPVGVVRASASVTPGNEIVFGDITEERGRLFLIKEIRTETDCEWVFPRNGGEVESGFLSSAATLIDTFDLFLSTAIVGGGDGKLRVLNVDGTVRWTFPTGAGSGPITSSPALDGSNTVYVTTPDGVLSAIDVSGRLTWQFGVGVPPPAAIAPSPAAGPSIYAIGAQGVLFAVTVNSLPGPNWVFTPKNPVTGDATPLSGSPSFAPDIFFVGATTVTDTIVYVVDVDGGVYGVRDFNGQILQLQRCTGEDVDLDNDCRMDSCAPFGATCDTQTDRCTNNVGPDTACTRDSCQPDLGTCVAINGSLGITAGTVAVTTSPVVSADPFVVVGTEDGRLCATTLNGLAPGYNLTPPTAAWASRCIALGDQPIRSSPAIGQNGEIYVTTDAGLYLIK